MIGILYTYEQTSYVIAKTHLKQQHVFSNNSLTTMTRKTIGEALITSGTSKLVDIHDAKLTAEMDAKFFISNPSLYWTIKQMSMTRNMDSKEFIQAYDIAAHRLGIPKYQAKVYVCIAVLMLYMAILKSCKHKDL